MWLELSAVVREVVQAALRTEGSCVGSCVGSIAYTTAYSTVGSCAVVQTGLRRRAGRTEEGGQD